MGKVRRLRKKYHLACQKSEPTSTDVVPVVESIPGRKEVPVIDSNIFAGLTISLSDLQQTLLPPSSAPVLGTVSEASVIGSQIEKSTKHVSKKDKRFARREALLRSEYFTRSSGLPSPKICEDLMEHFFPLCISLLPYLPEIDTVKKLRQEAKQASKRPKKSGPPKPMVMSSLFDALPKFTVHKDNNEASSSSKVSKDDKIPRVKAFDSKKKRKKTLYVEENDKLCDTAEVVKKYNLYLGFSFLCFRIDNISTMKSILSIKHYKADPASAITNFLLRTVDKKDNWSLK